MTGPFGPMPTVIDALRALADEFDRYDEAMAQIGRGHSDYGGQRRLARMVLDAADRDGWTPASVGCHWTRGAYTISTQAGGGTPSGYALFRDASQIGDRFASFAAAAAEAEAGAE